MRGGMKICELAFLWRSFPESGPESAEEMGGESDVLLSFYSHQAVARDGNQSKFNTPVDGFTRFFFLCPLFLIVPMQGNLLGFAPNPSVSIPLSCLCRFIQTVTTSTSCGPDLTSSLMYYAAFKTSRRSTTFPGIIERSKVPPACSVL